MTRRHLSAGVVALLLATCFLWPASAGAYRAFVGNSGGYGLTVFDTATNKVSGPDIGTDIYPSDIAISPDGTRAFVSNSFVDSVSVVDTATNTLATPNVVVGTSPRSVALTPDGKTLYVGVGDAEVRRIDTGSNALIGAPIPLAPSSYPYSIAITPDGTKAYVVNWGSSSVSVIDLNTNTVGPAIPVGNFPVNVEITPDGSKAYVVSEFDNAVAVIDTATDSVTVPAIPVGQAPSEVAITPDGSKAYVANFGDGNPDNSSDLSVIDTATDTVAGAPIPAGSGPSAIGITPNGKRAYVTNSWDDDVSSISLATGARTGPDIPVGLNPGAIAFTTVPYAGPPVLAKMVNLEPVKGKVKTKCRGEKKFTALTWAEQIPVGCLVDTRKGTVKLTSSKGKKGGTQSANFWSGLFRVTQKAGKKPYTELALAGSLGCGKSKKKRKRSFATRAAASSESTTLISKKKKRKRGRKLWGKGKGRFKTKGKYGSASVRGTNWLVEDRCNKSTFFKVKSGVVTVRDFGRKKNVKVKKGGHYVAKR
ncbi:MAG: YncE family protein [Solirubrobacterales bacterium]|nr:YncE family protein [Solirubrobacterales bacterium]